jgi:hypothetical protein
VVIDSRVGHMISNQVQGLSFLLNIMRDEPNDGRGGAF